MVLMTRPLEKLAGTLQCNTTQFSAFCFVQHVPQATQCTPHEASSFSLIYFVVKKGIPRKRRCWGFLFYDTTKLTTILRKQANENVA